MTNQFYVPAVGNTDPDWEIVERACIVRLGDGGPELYIDGNHASLGVISVAGLSTTDPNHPSQLKVITDFDGTKELCLSATANVDAQLAAKRIFAGASGGASITYYSIYSDHTIGAYPAGTRLPPQSASVFNIAQDNLWIRHLSLRWIGEGPMPA